MKHPLCVVVRAAAVVATLGFTPTFAGGARDFLNDAVKGDNAEIMLGKIGERRAATPAAREFAATLVADHSRARSETLRVAGHLHMRPSRGPAKEAMEERSRLDGLSGWAFDREFARYLVQDHQKDIAKFRKEADGGHGATQALAQRQLPTLRKHLDMALRLNARFARYTECQP